MHIPSAPSSNCKLENKRGVYFKCEHVVSSCNLESLNVLIRKLPTEHTDLLSLRCKSLAHWVVRYVQHGQTGPIWRRQCVTPGQQHHSMLLCLNYLPHLFLLLHSLLFRLSTSSCTETSWTGYSLARPTRKQRHLACSFINKGDPKRKKGRTGVMCQCDLLQEVTSQPLKPPLGHLPFNSTCYHNIDSDKWNPK